MKWLRVFLIYEVWVQTWGMLVAVPMFLWLLRKKKPITRDLARQDCKAMEEEGKNPVQP